MIRNSSSPSQMGLVFNNYRYLLIDYVRVIDKFSDLCRFIDSGCGKDEVTEYFTYLMGSYFTYGAPGMRLQMFEDLGKNDDYLEIDKGDEVVEVVELMDLVTRQWLPGYSVFGFDKHQVYLEETRGTTAILRIDQQYLQELCHARDPSDSSRLFG